MAEVSIELTLDELKVLCAVLGHELPVGVVEDDLELPEHVARRFADNARASLIARKVLTVGNPDVVNEAVASILGLAASPLLMLIVELEDDAIEAHFLLCDEDLGVQVSPLGPSAYRLTPFVTRDLIRRVVRLSDLRPADIAAEGVVTVSADELDRLLDLADRDLSATAEALGPFATDVATAQAFAEALAGRRRTVSVTAMHRPDDEVLEGGSTSWIDAGLWGNWATEAAGDDASDGPLSIHCVAHSAIVGELLSYLPFAMSSDAPSTL